MSWQSRVYKPSRGEAEPKGWRRLRSTVIRRDGGICQACEGGGKLTAHHIIPREAGGKDNLENLIALCNDCHNLIEQDIGVYNSRQAIQGVFVEVDIVAPAPGKDWHEWVYGGASRPPWPGPG